MRILDRKIPAILLLGDVACFFVALWLTLVIRYAGTFDRDIFIEHLIPFGVLFIIWIVVFFIAGLYEKRSVVLKNRLPGIIVQTQIANSVVAVVFFYFVTVFGITPKTNLFVYLVISLAFIYAWRSYGYYFFGGKKQEDTILIGSGEEALELKKEVDGSRHYNLRFVSFIDLDKTQSVNFENEVLEKIRGGRVSTLVVDTRNKKVEPLMASLYGLIFSQVRFVDMRKVYEDVFARIPLSLVRHNWFLENISTTPKRAYDVLKRAMDIVIASVLGVISLVVYPFVFLAIKMEDGGPIFIIQERVGKNSRPIFIRKFRSMNRNEINLDSNVKNSMTKVGKFIRKTRIDELPQLWNVIKGDLSLIGPRPELPSGVKLYEREIPYYSVRHLIKPGLSGWAQIYHDNHPHHNLAIQETKEKLSYDLYYLRNRSFVLDITIALKTIKELLSRGGL